MGYTCLRLRGKIKLKLTCSYVWFGDVLYGVWCCSMIWCVVGVCVVLYCVVLYCVVLCCIVLCCGVLCGVWRIVCVVWFDIMCGVLWFGVLWFGVLWFGLVCCGLVFCCLCLCFLRCWVVS